MCVGTDLWRPLIQTAAQSRATLDGVFRAPVQLSFEYFQGWRFYSLYWYLFQCLTTHMWWVLGVFFSYIGISLVATYDFCLLFNCSALLSIWLQLIYIIGIWGSWGAIRPFLSTYFFRLNNPDSQPALTCLMFQPPNHFFGPTLDLLQYTNVFLLLCVQLYVCICVCVYLEMSWMSLNILLQVIKF